MHTHNYYILKHRMSIVHLLINYSKKCFCFINFRIHAEIDECALGISGCSQICTNTIGSFSCACYYGYQLDANNKTCTCMLRCVCACVCGVYAYVCGVCACVCDVYACVCGVCACVCGVYACMMCVCVGVWGMCMCVHG